MRLLIPPNSKFSSYTTPISKRRIERGVPFNVVPGEADLLLNTGYFIEVSDEGLVGSAHIGVDSGEEHFRMTLPDDWEGLGILIKNRGGIGDSLIGCGLVTYLKQRTCVITMATLKPAVRFVEHIQGVDRAILLSSVTELDVMNQFDVILDISDFLQADSRTVVAEDYYAAAFRTAGIVGDVTIPRLIAPPLDPISRRVANGAIVKHRRCVAIHMTPSGLQREWHLAGWREVILNLTSRGSACLIFGEASEDAFPFEDIEGATDCTNLDVTQQLALAHFCCAFVGVDSCWMHIMGLFQKPIVGLFGPSKAHFVASRYYKVVPITGVPCLCRNILRHADCASGFACMQSISAAAVCDAANDLLTNPRERQENLKKTRKGKREPSTIAELQPRTVEHLRRNTRVCCVLPWRFFGGGEVSMIEIAEGLSPFFDLDVKVFDTTGREASVEFDNAVARFGDRVQYVASADLATNLFGEYDVVIWYGPNEEIPKQLMHFPNRPVSIRVVHTHYAEEGRDFHRRWKHVIDSTICVSPVIAEELKREQNSEHIAWIPNPIPRKLTRKGRRPKTDSPRKVIGFLGRFDHNKNIMWLVENLEALQCDLVVKGIPSPELSKEDLIRAATAKGVLDRITFIKPDRDIGKFFGMIDALTVVSKTEGFPMIVAEAGHYGVPVIATPVGALPTVFRNEVIFVDQDRLGFPRADSLQSEIEDIADDDGARLQVRVKEICSHEIVVDQYRQFIRNAFGRGFPTEIQSGSFGLTRFEGVGDILVSSAIVRRLVETLPGATFQYQTKESMVPLMSRLFPHMDVRIGQVHTDYKIPIIYQKCWERDQHMTEGMGCKMVEVTIPPVEGPKTKRRKKKIGFAIYQNATSPNRTKEWPLGRWEALAENLKKQGFNCIQLGAKTERRMTFLNDGRSEDVEGLIKQINDMNLVVSVENAVPHIGWALRIPMVVLVGRSSSEAVTSYPGFHTFITDESESQRCWASILGDDATDCCLKSGKLSCMDGVDVDKVAEAVKKMV